MVALFRLLDKDVCDLKEKVKELEKKVNEK